MLVSGLHMAALSLNEDQMVTERGTVPSKKQKEERIRQIRTAFINRLHANRPWAYYLAFCELLNLLNVFLQIYMTNRFLGGAFMNLGQNVAAHNSADELDPLDIVFPKVSFVRTYSVGTLCRNAALGQSIYHLLAANPSKTRRDAVGAWCSCLFCTTRKVNNNYILLLFWETNTNDQFIQMHKILIDNANL